MLIQHLHRDVPESGLVGCCQYDRRCNHGFQGLFPAKGAEAPAVTGFKAWKPELGARRTEVVAPRFGIIQKLPGESGAYDMRAFITGAGLTFSRAKKACLGSITAYLQDATQDVSLSFHIRLPSMIVEVYYNALKWEKKAKANFTVKGRWRF
jgi:hypothetical protein